MQGRIRMDFAPEEATRGRRVDIQASNEHRWRIPGARDQQSIRLKEIKFGQHSGIKVSMDASQRRMEAAEYGMCVLHLRRLIRPMPARLRLRAVEHMESLTHARRRLRQRVKERRAIWSGDVREYDETHR